MVFQVSREVPGNISVGTAEVIHDENLAPWHDAERTQPVTSLEFDAALLQPPLDRFSGEGGVTVYIQNLSDIDLTPIAPCNDVNAPDGTRIGFNHALLEEPVTFDHLGSTCERDMVLAPGQMVLAFVVVSDISPDLPPGDYSFTALFGAVGEGEVPESGLVLLGDNFDLSSGATTNRRSPSVAYNSQDNQYLAAWFDSRNPGTNDIFGQRVSAAADLLGDNIAMQEFSASQSSPVVAYGSVQNSYLAAWQTQQSGFFNQARGKIVPADGVVAVDDLFLIDGGLEIDVAYSPTSDMYLVTGRAGAIVGASFDGNGAPVDPQVAFSAGGAPAPNGGVGYNSNDNEFLVTWRDQTEDNLKARRVSPGTGLLGDPFVITPEFPESGRAADVAFDPVNNRYLVVYGVFDSGNIKGQFVGADGALIGEAFEIAADLATRAIPAIAYSAADQAYLVAFKDASSIAGQMVQADGTVVGARLLIGDATSINGHPAVAYNSQTGEFLVVWSDNRNLEAGEQTSSAR